MTKEKNEDFEKLIVDIDRISYSRLVNLGDFQNEKLEVQAQVKPSQDPDQVLAYLKQYVDDQTHSAMRYRTWCDDYRRKEQQLKELNEKVKRANETWDRVRTFLLSQGIKTEDQVPTMTNLLPAATFEPEPEPEVVDIDDVGF